MAHLKILERRNQLMSEIADQKEEEAAPSNSRSEQQKKKKGPKLIINTFNT